MAASSRAYSPRADFQTGGRMFCRRVSSALFSHSGPRGFADLLAVELQAFRIVGAKPRPEVQHAPEDGLLQGLQAQIVELHLRFVVALAPARGSAPDASASMNNGAAAVLTRRRRLSLSEPNITNIRFTSPGRFIWSRADFSADMAFTPASLVSSLLRFVVLPQRWIVERTFAWLSNSRSLSMDEEILASLSETYVLISTSHLMVRRLSRA